MPLQKLSAVLFDMDGLMIDSERGGVTACRRAGEEMGLSAERAEAFAIACMAPTKPAAASCFLPFFLTYPTMNFPIAATRSVCTCGKRKAHP